MKYIIIAAIGKYREIGRNGKLLWNLPREMQFFKETTIGHTVVMGRKSWESIPDKFRPLPERNNLVVTRNLEYIADGATVITNLRDIPKHIDTKKEDKCFIIGGTQIFQLAFDYGLVDEMYITHIHEGFPKADTFFPYFNKDYWEEEEIFSYEKDEKNPFSFTVYHYVR